MPQIGTPAYQGRPDPSKIARRFMLIVIILLILGFFRAVIENDWIRLFLKSLEY